MKLTLKYQMTTCKCKHYGRNYKVLKFFSTLFVVFLQNCPHGRPTMRHLINLNMVP